jgi:predicted metalloenzyme YecM
MVIAGKTTSMPSQKTGQINWVELPFPKHKKSYP